MPLSSSGEKVLSSMQASYGPDKGKRVFYASITKGKPGSSKWEGRRSTAAPARSLSRGSR